jgi:hypothetical protein
MNLYWKCILFASTLAAVSAPSWAGMKDLTQISVDTTTSPLGQHRTEVDPSQAAFGNTIVSTFQDGELTTNGALKVGWSTSHDGGITWEHGYIPGTTTDFWVQVVAFDLKHSTWLIIMIPQDVNQNTLGMQVSRSSDGLHWSVPEYLYGPVNVNNEYTNRPWIGCDNYLFSPHFGNCYVAWQDATGLSGSNAISQNYLSVSNNGGFSWTAPAASPDVTAGSVGGVAIQPNGNVFLIGVYGGPNLPQLYSIESADGGKTLKPSVYITTEYFNYAAQGYMRDDPFPSAGVSPDGTIYVVTADCRFRANCPPGENVGTANDVVYTTSRDGVNWTPITRIPIDPVTSNIDHFITGVAVRGNVANLWGNDSQNGLAVNYYYLTDAATCNPTLPDQTCRLFAGFISSNDDGKTWSEPVQVAGPMNILDLTQTEFGYYVANDITSIYVQGQPQAVYSIALPRDQKTGLYNQSIYSARFSY